MSGSAQCATWERWWRAAEAWPDAQQDAAGVPEIPNALAVKKGQFVT